MRILLLGAGAMGTIIGAYLSEKGYDVELADSYQAHVDELNAKGAHIVGCVDKVVPVKAVALDGLTGRYDLVLSLTKQTTMRQALQTALPYLHGKSIVMTLQNGIPEDIAAEYVGMDRVMGGGMEFSGTFVSPGVSKLASGEDTLGISFGRPDGQITPEALEIQAMFQDALGHCELTTNLRGVRYTKLTDNSCFSGLATALGCLVGDILDDHRAMECIACTGREAAHIIRALGVQPVELFGLCPTVENVGFQTREELERAIGYWRKIYAPYRGQKASMLQDLEKGRVCEIQQINGKFVAEGAKAGIATPFNSKIVALVTQIQNGERKLETAWENLKEFPLPELG